MVKPVRFVMLLGFLTAFSIRAAADPIRVTGGFIEVGAFPEDRRGFEFGSVSLQGDNFSIVGRQNGLFNVGVGVNCLDLFRPCSAGAEVSFGNPAGGELQTFSSATINGTQYPFPTLSVVDWEFHADAMVIPGNAAGTVTLQTPFALTGTIFLDLVGGFPFVGQGTASLVLREFPARPLTIPSGFLATGVRFDFADAASPTPEPASLLLVASGGTLMWRKRRQAAGAPPDRAQYPRTKGTQL